jgi:hypothetical protein
MLSLVTLHEAPSRNPSSPWPAAEWARACVRFIQVFTATYLAAGLVALVAWRITGNVSWVEYYFRVPGAFVLVFLAAASLVLCRRVQREFSPAQPMYRAWRLIVISTVCDLTGALFTQFLSVPMALNPLAHTSWWSPALAAWLRQFGQSAGGSLRFAFLAAGLFQALRVYRKSGFLAGLTVPDWALLAAAGAYIVREATDLIYALRLGKHPAPAEVLGWPTDPLLWILLAESILLYRSVHQMGPGWIGRCWQAFSLGISFIVLGDVAIWATAYGFLPWPWSSIGWYLWLPAAAAFALAPAYQLDAIYRAYTSRIRPQPPASSSH